MHQGQHRDERSKSVADCALLLRQAGLQLGTLTACHGAADSTTYRTTYHRQLRHENLSKRQLYKIICHNLAGKCYGKRKTMSIFFIAVKTLNIRAENYA